MNVIFFGSSKFVITIIEVLKKNFDLALIVTTENPKLNLIASRGETLGSPVINYCTQHKLSYLSLQQFNNSTIKQLKLSNASVGILASFGAIIPNEVLNLFPKGIINIHPSLLPRYRGPTPVQTAILNGDKTTGVTIIKLDEEVDHGPILTQQKEEILPSDTSESLYERLFALGATLMIRIIKVYMDGKIIPRKQNHREATFTKTLTRKDGYFDIQSPPSPQVLDRTIRAYYPWPSVWTKWTMENGKWKIIKLLPDKKIQVEGKKPMTYKDFLNGYENVIPNSFRDLIEILK